MLLSQSCPRPRQSHSQHPPRDTERRRRLLRGQAVNINQLERCPLKRRQVRTALEQLSAGALRVDPLGQLVDFVPGQLANPAKPIAAALRFDICSQCPA